MTTSARKSMPGWAMILVVTLISVAAAAMVAGVYRMTEGRIIENMRQDRLRGIEQALQSGGSVGTDPDENARIIDLGAERGNRKVTLYRSDDTLGEHLGTAAEAASDRGYGGRIRVMVGIDPDGTVRGVTVLEQAETPGLGARIREPEFLDQFIGKSLDSFDFKVEKDGRNVHAITAATISSRAVAEAVEDALIAAEAPAP